MPLEDTYSDEFLRVYAAYPSWKTGRTKKALAWKAWKSAKKALKFTDEDVNYIVSHINRRKDKDVKWQVGNQYGYQGLQVFINQRGWNDDYETKADKVKAQQQRSTWNPDPVWKQYGYESAEAYEAAQEAQAPRISEVLRGLTRDLERSSRKVH